ncbi:ApbA domain-containing protein [Ceratobasidium sp. AG-Ba]|nr:ApbA domain-containing protein [Ceratobasidium sp. AG-Ba]
MTSTAQTIRVLVVGAGAVGCFYASRLQTDRTSNPSAEVSLVCRSNYKPIAERGVILKTRSFGDYTFAPKHVFSSVAEAAKVKDVWDYVVVTTKALPDVSDDSAVIEPVVTSGKSAIVLIQNGVGVEEPYRKRFSHNPILSAVTVISAEQVEPGVIINASMNPSSVLSNGTGNARMSVDPELRHHLRETMLEVFRAAEAVLGRPVPPTLATADKILTSTERNTGGKPSMLLDWERGAVMELEVILGNPIRLARAKGVDMPRLQTMYALLKMAQTRRDEDKGKNKNKARL